MIDFISDFIVVMGLISITMCSFAISYFVTDTILTYLKSK